MKLVKHVAIIMDGNGRWGIAKKNNRNYGHKKGLDSVDNVVKSCLEKNIKFLTLFTFSTENWKRPQKEISFLFSLLKNFLKKISNAEKITYSNTKLQNNITLK